MTFKPSSRFWGQVQPMHRDHLQRAAVGSTQLRHMHCASLCVFSPTWTLCCWQCTCMNLVQKLGLLLGTLTWETCLWACEWICPTNEVRELKFSNYMTAIETSLWSNLHCHQRTVWKLRSISRWNGYSDAPFHWQQALIPRELAACPPPNNSSKLQVL